MTRTLTAHLQTLLVLLGKLPSLHALAIEERDESGLRIGLIRTDGIEAKRQTGQKRDRDQQVLRHENGLGVLVEFGTRAKKSACRQSIDKRSELLVADNRGRN